MSLLFFSVPWTIKLAVLFDSGVITLLGVITSILVLCLYGTSKPWSAYIAGLLLAVVTIGTIAWEQGSLWGYWSEQTAFWFGGVLPR